MRVLAVIESQITRQRAFILACLIVPLLLVLEIAAIWSDPSLAGRFPYGHDFAAFWAAARLAGEGRIDALYDPAVFGALQESVAVREGYLGWFYPPTWLLAVLPLGKLPFGLAWGVFSAVGLAALALAARPFLKGRDRIGWLLLFGAPVVAITLVQGQNGALVAALIVGGFAAREARHGWLAALLFAALAVKPHMAVLIPVALVAARDWRLIGRTALLTAAVMALTGVALGWESWHLFLAHLGDARAAATDRAVLAQMPTAYASALMAGLPGQVAAAAQGASALVAFWATWRLWHAPAMPFDLRLAGILMAVLLVPPYGFRYDMVVVLAATLLLLGRAAQDGFRPGERLILALLWLAPLILPNIAFATGLPVGLVLLLLGLLSVIRRARPAS